MEHKDRQTDHVLWPMEFHSRYMEYIYNACWQFVKLWLNGYVCVCVCVCRWVCSDIKRLLVRYALLLWELKWSESPRFRNVPRHVLGSINVESESVCVEEEDSGKPPSSVEDIT